jgi:UDP-2,3-diacylglucosamine pyrophosphatase LpxH
MSQSKEETFKQLKRIWKDPNIKVLETKDKRYVLMSDLHLGDGGDADDIRDNVETLTTALDYYNKENYFLILLGDIEEFWQFDLEAIVNQYANTVYKKMKDFGTNRISRVYGNHDYEWKAFDDPITSDFEGVAGVPEALKLKDENDVPRILLLHGHQGSLESDKKSWYSRFWVRMFAKVENQAKWLGLYRHPSATKSQIAKDYERIFYAWAKKNKVIIICGHSHRAIFASLSYVDRLEMEKRQLQKEVLKVRNTMSGKEKKRKIKKFVKEIDDIQKKISEERAKGRDIDSTEPGKKPVPCYFNIGCGLYTDGITCIEIDKGEIRLVKWHNNPAMEPRHEPFKDCTGYLNDFLKEI